MADEYIEVTDVEVPFQTEEEVVVGDLSKVTSDILPICQNVLGEIRKAGRQASQKGDTKGVKLEMFIVDGIPTQNGDGDIEYRLRNKVVFPPSRDLLYWRDTKVKTSDYYKDNGAWLRGLKELLSALRMDITKVKINDEFFGGLVGKRVLFSIKHEPNQTQNEAGEWVNDGTFRERVYGWKKAVEE